ncbi:hypothetical protein HAX54_043764 [Datura stramonium]|uniref:Uncharacterized protein n=1 Tax=Datura stramonium TaxID=4076 RepID=A0ABS8SNW3_DATST|nr:hypothetical protein [Datura stramonium]
MNSSSCCKWFCLPPDEMTHDLQGFEALFNILRVKGVHGRGRKERNTDSKDDSDGLSGDRASLAAMQELLGRLPRLPQGGASSNVVVVDLEAYREQLPH